MTTSENAVQGRQDERGELLRALAARHTKVHLGMPDFRTSAGRLTDSSRSG
ncbi:hypothetical protein ACFW9F_03155 [Streptomyces sp. NPDC059506]|uniref:hypothetical protein n=1 Tax=Streptomyces TaxID=1883 RepID=UPI0026923E64